MRILFVFWTVFCFLVSAYDVKADEGSTLFVNEKEIIAAVQKEFVNQGLAEDADVELEFFGGQTSFQIEGAKKAKILIENLQTDDATGRFGCDAEIFADGRSYARASLQGKYYLQTEVWVPVRNIAKGEIVTEAMLTSKKIRTGRLKPMMVTDKDRLINQEAKKSLKEGRVISEKDIGERILVKRNDVVLIIYRTDKMQITAKAVAKQDGALGERIELENLKSKKTVTGLVQDASTVIVEQ